MTIPKKRSGWEHDLVQKQVEFRSTQIRMQVADYLEARQSNYTVSISECSLKCELTQTYLAWLRILVANDQDVLSGCRCRCAFVWHHHCRRMPMLFQVTKRLVLILFALWAQNYDNSIQPCWTIYTWVRQAMHMTRAWAMHGPEAWSLDQSGTREVIIYHLKGLTTFLFYF